MDIVDWYCLGLRGYLHLLDKRGRYISFDYNTKDPYISSLI
jgi:hypothetical protein